MGPLQVDKTTVWHIFSIWRVATPNPYGPWRPPSHQHRWWHPNSRVWHYRDGSQDHDRNLIAVLERFEQHHVKLNLSKMKFLVREAVFMGHVITTNGLQPNPITVQAIVNMPTPKDKQGVCRFLGTINYLSKFCPLLSTVTQPLRNLTKDDVQFLWSAKHQHTFNAAKALATSAPCLTYYEVTAPVILQVFASDYRLGAALLQPSKHQDSCTFDKSCSQPVAYSSKSLTPTEQRYA